MLQYQWGVLVLKARLKENMMKATSTGSVGGRNSGRYGIPEAGCGFAERLHFRLFRSRLLGPFPSSKNNNGGGGGRAGARIAEQSVLGTEVGEALGIASMSSRAFPDSMKTGMKFLKSSSSPATGKPGIWLH